MDLKLNLEIRFGKISCFINFIYFGRKLNNMSHGKYSDLEMYTCMFASLCSYKDAIMPNLIWFLLHINLCCTYVLLF